MKEDSVKEIRLQELCAIIFVVIVGIFVILLLLLSFPLRSVAGQSIGQVGSATSM